MATTTIKGQGKIPSVYRDTAIQNSAVQVSSVPCVLTGVNIINPNGVSEKIYIKFYNAPSAVVGTTAITKTIFCGGGESVFISATELGMQYFDTAMCVAAVRDIADSGTSALTTAAYLEVSYFIS